MDCQKRIKSAEVIREALPVYIPTKQVWNRFKSHAQWGSNESDRRSNRLRWQGLGRDVHVLWEIARHERPGWSILIWRTDCRRSCNLIIIECPFSREETTSPQSSTDILDPFPSDSASGSVVKAPTASASISSHHPDKVTSTGFATLRRLTFRSFPAHVIAIVYYSPLSRQAFLERPRQINIV